jgi:hypothetical protein
MLSLTSHQDVRVPLALRIFPGQKTATELMNDSVIQAPGRLQQVDVLLQQVDVLLQQVDVLLQQVDVLLQQVDVLLQQVDVLLCTRMSYVFIYNISVCTYMWMCTHILNTYIYIYIYIYIYAHTHSHTN